MATATKAPSLKKGKKGDGMITEIPSSARKRLKQYQDAIKASKKGFWRPAPNIHEFGEKFYSVLVGLSHSEKEDKKTKVLLNNYSLCYEYMADDDADDRAKKCDKKPWRGKFFSDRIWKDPKTGEERCFDFADLKAIASLITKEEIDDGEEALNAILKAAKGGDVILQMSLIERPRSDGKGEPMIEERIHSVATSTETTDSDDDEDDEIEEDDDEPTEDEDDDSDDADDDDEDEEDEAPPPPPKKKKK